MSGRYVYFIFICSILLLSSCSNTEEIKNTDQHLPAVEVLTIETGKQRTFTVNGEVTPQRSAHITGEFRADVVAIHADIGNHVKKDQLLVQLHSESIIASWNTAQRALTQAMYSLTHTNNSSDKNIESAQKSLEQAHINLDNTLQQNKKKRKQAEEVLASGKLNLTIKSN